MMNLKTEICNAFHANAITYEQFAVAQKEIGNRLFERLAYLKIQPQWVLDLGCGTGYFLDKLKTQYPNAHVVGVDFAWSMLTEAKQKTSRLVQADIQHLPFKEGVFDLVFANQVIHWNYPIPQLMREVNRVMHPNGCFMFSSLGPDTFCELKKAWAAVDAHAHVNPFMDMHEIGDILMETSFEDPVMDMEMLYLHYPSLSQLLQALKAQGVKNIHTSRNKGLTGRTAWRQFETEMQHFYTETGQVPLTYEIIYGHTWKGLAQEKCRETFIPVSQLTYR